MKTAIKNRVTYDKTHSLFDVVNTLVNGEHLGHSVLIPNICNIKSPNFSNGFASTLAQYFPAALDGYKVLSNNERKLGYCQILQAGTCKNKQYSHKIYIANMMCQIGFNSKTNRNRNINYAAMAACLNKINHFINNHVPKESACEIRTHKYLVNYIGADSRFVAYLLEDTFNSTNVVVHLN